MCLDLRNERPQGNGCKPSARIEVSFTDLLIRTDDTSPRNWLADRGTGHRESRWAAEAATSLSGVGWAQHIWVTFTVHPSHTLSVSLVSRDTAGRLPPIATASSAPLGVRLNDRDADSTTPLHPIVLRFLRLRFREKHRTQPPPSLASPTSTRPKQSRKALHLGDCAATVRVIAVAFTSKSVHHITSSRPTSFYDVHRPSRPSSTRADRAIESDGMRDPEPSSMVQEQDVSSSFINYIN